jgi:preprotein translocase subunit SecA
MEFLERLWEIVGVFSSGVLSRFERTITYFFGSSNARHIKRLHAKVEAINSLEPKYEEMSDEELRAQSDLFRERLVAGETLDDILVEAFAVCREGGRRWLKMRHYDVQLVGGMVLHGGSIAEMVTGEGKTLVATLPAYLNGLSGNGVHVVTVNDYLARRDMEWMAPLYLGLGLSVGAIQSHMEVRDRQKMYDLDITYGTNNEFGFDYLRDNMRPAARGDDRFPKEHQQSQGRLTFAIIDEVDNILIDEARTPLIISGPAHDNVDKYPKVDKLARQLIKDTHFVVNEKDHSANMTDEGVREAEKLAGVESFYTAGNMDWPHMIDNALKAHHLYKRDVNYVVKEGKVIIVDEFTGRLMDGRQWSDGLHQAVEAKEGVTIKKETQTLATITLQNFFKLYDTICGMTGTAMTEANEFWKIYELDVVAIPTNRPMKRASHPDVIYRTEREKYVALADEIERTVKWDVMVLKNREIWGEISKETDDVIEYVAKGGKGKEQVKKSEVQSIEYQGRPVLVGTVSIEKSERVSRLLGERGIKHEVLNAKYHKREAEIVAQAGRHAAVTIATNMAGRGTDIVLGGNADTMAWAQLQDSYETRLDIPKEEWDALVAKIDKDEKMTESGDSIKEIGGLHVIGTERHESRRIDLQLRGRCGRQGDPGSSRFFLSLEDDLMRIFAGPWVTALLDKLGMQDGEAIESSMVSRRIEAAQKKVEERNFEIRKNLLEYDEVMDEQRKRVYSYRQQILDGVNCRDLILVMIREQVEEHVGAFMESDYGIESFAKFAGGRLSCHLEARDFRGMGFKDADIHARSEGERAAENAIYGAIDENLPNTEEEAEWNWDAMAKFANTSWGLQLRDRDLKKAGRDSVDGFLIEKSREALAKVDLSEGAPALDPDIGLKSVVAWVGVKFAFELSLEEIQGLDTESLTELVCQRAESSYDDRESEYPVMAGFYQFAKPTANGVRIDGAGLVEWARRRFEAELSADDIRNKNADDIRELLIDRSRRSLEEAKKAIQTIDKHVEQIFHDVGEDATAGHAANGSGALVTVADWLERIDCRVEPDELAPMKRDELYRRLANAVEDKYRPEIRRMERSLMLQIVDTGWKDHLLVMDHLRSSVGLKGYAQLDPKVEYKREGMKFFENMWQAIGERTTDLIFRMEQLDEDFVGSTWVETSASHDDASSSSIGQEQQDAIDASQGEAPAVTIRNRGNDRVGRNDPCPCGSGKKYKNCCRRKGGDVLV